MATSWPCNPWKAGASWSWGFSLPSCPEVPPGTCPACQFDGQRPWSADDPTWLPSRGQVGPGSFFFPKPSVILKGGVQIGQRMFGPLLLRPPSGNCPQAPASTYPRNTPGAPSRAPFPHLVIYGSVVSTLLSALRPRSLPAEGPIGSVMPRPSLPPLIQGISPFCCSGQNLGGSSLSPQDPSPPVST